MRRPRSLGAATMLGVLFGALMWPGASSAQTFDINVVLPLTGGAAFLGKAEQQSLTQLEKTVAASGGIHGRHLRFVYHDDQSNPQIAVQVATQIVASKPPVILGSAVVATCNAMAPLMRRGPVLYCFSPGLYPAPGSFVFSSSASTRDLASSLLRYVRLRGWSKVALITSTDASGQDALRQIKELTALPDHKEIQLVGEASFNPTDVSAAAQIQRLKGAQPQVLIAWTTGAPVGTVFKAIVDAGLDVPVATTDGNMTHAQMTQYASFLPKELYIPSPEWVPSTRKDIPAEVTAAKEFFFKAFEGTDIKPDGPSTFAWDPAFLVVTALRKLDPNATADQLRDYLAKWEGVAGINGIYNFPKDPQRGLDETNVVVTRWDAAKSTWVVVSEPGGKPITP